MRKASSNRWIGTGPWEEGSGSVHICCELTSSFSLVSGMKQRYAGTHLAPGVPLCESQGFSILFLCLPMRMLTIALGHLWFHRFSWWDQSAFLSFSMLPISQPDNFALGSMHLGNWGPKHWLVVPIQLSEHRSVHTVASRVEGRIGVTGKRSRPFCGSYSPWELLTNLHRQVHVTEKTLSKLPCLRPLPLTLLQCPPHTPGSSQQRFPIPKSQLRLFRQDSDEQPNVEVLLGNLSGSMQLLRGGPDFTGPHLNQMDIVSCDAGPGRTEGQDKGQARLLRRPAAKHWKQT